MAILNRFFLSYVVESVFLLSQLQFKIRTSGFSFAYSFWCRIYVFLITTIMKCWQNGWKKCLTNLGWRDWIELPYFVSQTLSIESFCESVFLTVELEDACQNSTFFQDRAILTFQSDLVAGFNQTLLGRLPGELHAYNLMDAVQDNAEE